MLGTKILIDGASRFDSAKLAEALTKAGLPLQRVGTRDLWEYPGGGARSPGAPVAVGKFKFHYASVYFDGRGVFLWLGGPKVVESTFEIGDFWGTIKYTPRTHTELVTNTPI